MHLCDADLGHISEIFDGDAPHQPVGCMAQAWSVAEVLRAAVEDVCRIRPEQPAALIDKEGNQQTTFGISCVEMDYVEALHGNGCFYTYH